MSDWPHLCRLARSDWSHSSPEQRILLLRRIQETLDGQLGAGTSSTFADHSSLVHCRGGLPTLPQIRSTEEYESGKRNFQQRFMRYKVLDAELAARTAQFEELERRYRNAAEPAARKAAEDALTEAFFAHKSELETKSKEHRELHIELQWLKAAIGDFAEDVNRRIKASAT